MQTAVITGGGGGLGRALANGMQAQGWHVVLLDRDVSGLTPSATRTVIEADLTDPNAMALVVERICRNFPETSLVVYNAGVTQIGAFADVDMHTHRKVMEINYFAAISLARQMQDQLRKTQGTHLAISSVAGFSPLYQRVAYSASKHALEGAFASLRSEERPYGVRVQIAAPSFVATNPGAAIGAGGIERPGGARDGIGHISPESAARTILWGLLRGKDFIPVGRVAWLSWLIHRLSPRLFQRLMERKIRGV